MLHSYFSDRKEVISARICPHNSSKHLTALAKQSVHSIYDPGFEKCRRNAREVSEEDRRSETRRYSYIKKCHIHWQEMESDVIRQNIFCGRKREQNVKPSSFGSSSAHIYRTSYFLLIRESRVRNSTQFSCYMDGVSTWFSSVPLRLCPGCVSAYAISDFFRILSSLVFFNPIFQQIYF